MNTVFDLINDFKRSQLEISSDASYDLLCEYLVPIRKKSFQKT